VTSVSVSAVTRMMFGRGGEARWISVIGGFFDDSGTHPESTLVVLGGLLGTEAQWDLFHAEWSALVAAPLPGKPALEKGFHLAHCRASDGEFFDYSVPEKDRVEYLFRQVILKAGLFSLAVSVDKLAWDEIVTGTLKEEFGTALECCFVRCMELIISTLRSRKPGEPVHLFFDQGIQDRLSGWAQLYKSQAKRYPEISGVAYAPVSKVLALQGADTIASHTYQFGLEWLKDRNNPAVNPHFRDFIAREFTTGIIIDRAAIEGGITAFLASGKRQP
jgi:hypothetical protein